MIRNLKHYSWQLIEEDGTIVAFDKKRNVSLVLSMAMADSFVRAYISFKTRKGISEKKALREKYQKRVEGMLERIEKLKSRKEVENVD